MIYTHRKEKIQDMSSKIYLNGAFSYKQICEKLHVEPKRGGAQKVHIQELHKTHNFEERKLNATTKIYVFNDGDKDNKVTSGYEDFDLTITSGYIRYLVYRTLLEEHNQVLDLTLDDIRKKLKICNNNYEFALYNADKTTVIKEAVHLPQMTRELNEYIRKHSYESLYRSLYQFQHILPLSVLDHCLHVHMEFLISAILHIRPVQPYCLPDYPYIEQTLVKNHPHNSPEYTVCNYL